jgi:hypothetical protein
MQCFIVMSLLRLFEGKIVNIAIKALPDKVFNRVPIRLATPLNK